MKPYPIITKGLVVVIVLGFVCLCIIPGGALKNGKPSLITSKENRLLIGENEFCATQIHLTKRHLPMLTKAISSLNNSFYKTILKQIRCTLEKKGSLDRSDLMTLTNTMGISNISFYCGYMTARGETGFAAIFPFTFFALFLYSLKHFYIGPILVGMWFTDWESNDHSWEGVSFSINGREVFIGASSGIALGGFGVFYSLPFEKPEFDFVGLFPLIIVNDNPL
jgi:hypothetical protein